MRIAFYSPQGRSSGISTYVSIISDALRELGHDVLVVGGTAEAAFTEAKLFNADVFEIEESFGWAGDLAGRGLPIIMRMHGPHALVRKHVDVDVGGDKRERAELASLRKVDAVTFPTQSLFEAVMELCSPTPSIYLGTPRISRVISNPMPLGEAVWQGQDSETILYVGRIDRLKGADRAIEAFTEALKQRPSLRMIMAGPGETVPAPPEVTFLGEQTHEQLNKLRQTSAIGLVPSRYETFSYTAAEAMAVGLPVLSSMAPGTFEIVSYARAGKCTADLASAMLEMVGNPRLQEWSDNGRAFVSRWLDPRTIAQQTVDLYLAARSRHKVLVA